MFAIDRIWRNEGAACRHHHVGMKVQPVGTITIPVEVGTCPQQITKELNFLVVDCSSSYNAIIGRLTLNSWKAVTSTYHLSIKFPIEYGVGQV